MPPGFKPLVRCGLMLAGILIFSACTAQYPLNTKIEITQSPHLVSHKLASLERSDRLFLVLAFSGGGTRAAALSYGVLEALAKVELPDPAKQKNIAGREHTLLGEVDMIYSVSGGIILNKNDIEHFVNHCLLPFLSGENESRMILII